MESLLCKIRKDVFVQARGIEFGEWFYRLIDWLCEMSDFVGKEGLLALEEEVITIPPEIALHEEIQWVVSLVVDGTDPGEIIDAAIARYWMGHYQGKDALLYYITILGFLRIQAGENTMSIRHSFVSYLPQDAAEQYKDYRDRKLAPIRAARREKLFQDAPVLEVQWTVRTLLEEKILQAEDKTIQRALRDIDNDDFITALKGLSSAARQKFLSNLSDRMVDMFVEDWENAQSVSRYDLKRAFGTILCTFEDAQKELEEK